MADFRQVSDGGAPDSADFIEVAHQLQISVTTVTRWAKSGWLVSAITDAGERYFEADPAVGRPLAD